MSLSRKLLSFASSSALSVRVSAQRSHIGRSFLTVTSKSPVATAHMVAREGSRHPIFCSCCGVSSRGYQTNGRRNASGDKQMLEFLNEEIKEETKSHSGNLPAFEGFDVTSDDAIVTLTKKWQNETITIKFNVNNSVQMDEELPEDEKDDEQSAAATISTPHFTIEINKGGRQRLALQCAFPTEDDVATEEPEDGKSSEEDAFEIEELALYDKEWNEKTYSVQSEFMDGTLYDLLMQMLEDRGINNKFASQLVDFSTKYEHGSYIKFLENMRDFVKNK